MYDEYESKEVIIRDVIKHKQYADIYPNDPNNDLLVNDIALIRVDPLNFNENSFKPVCISNDSSMFKGKKCYAAGWGTTSNDDPDYGDTWPSVLQSVSVTYHGGACEDYGEEFYNYYPSIICAGSDEYKVFIQPIDLTAKHSIF